jgi:broad specificity phosphatase PhoE
LMAVCSGIKRDGSRCTATVEAPQEYCWWHDPANADKRRRAASKGGRGGGGKEIRDLKKRISEVIEAVLEGSQDRGRAAVAIQGFNALKSVLELERRIKETEELEARIESLEQTQKGGGRAWGA